ncbi:MAG: hypothetical protein PHY32_02940 [Candidatus Pacebacteria bacterium]|nr:hypothetical protein [Candidatus Paceibacterota bacterium]
MSRKMKIDVCSLVLCGILLFILAGFGYGIYYKCNQKPHSVGFSGMLLPQVVSENLPYAIRSKWGGQDRMDLGKGYFYTFSKKVLTTPDGIEHSVVIVITKDKTHTQIDVR